MSATRVREWSQGRCHGGGTRDCSNVKGRCTASGTALLRDRVTRFSTGTGATGTEWAAARMAPGSRVDGKLTTECASQSAASAGAAVTEYLVGTPTLGVEPSSTLTVESMLEIGENVQSYCRATTCTRSCGTHSCGSAENEVELIEAVSRSVKCHARCAARALHPTATPPFSRSATHTSGTC